MAEKRRDSRGRRLPPGFYEDKNGLYSSRFSYGGRRYALYSKNLEELKKKTVQAKADLERGVYLDIDNSTTLNKFFYKYMEQYKQPRLKAVTYKNDLRMWELYIEKSVIGKSKLKDIRRIQIAKVLNDLYNVNNLSWNTMKLIISLLNGCLTEAVNNGLIARNPADKIGRELKRNDKKPKERQALTEEQQNAFIEYIKQSMTYRRYLPFFSFLLATGCRVGEASGITWGDISLFKGEININHTLQYKKLGKATEFHITSPKTEKSNRTIPMLQGLKHQLIEQKKYNFMLNIPNDFEVDGYSDFVFMTRTGKPYTNANVNRIIGDIVKAYNEEETRKAVEEKRAPVLLPSFSAHSLRHTFCTRFCESTSDIKSVQAIMGHSDIQTTLGIYAHSTEKKKAESMVELEGKINIG